MGTLKAVIDGLATLSIAFGTVPIVGENLKSAAELTSKICEKVQNMKENREGYQQLGVQAAGLLMAVQSVLDQAKGDKDPERIMNASVQPLLDVLDDIHNAVKKRIPSDAQALRRRDRISAWFKHTSTDVKRIYKDADELQEHHRKLTNVVEGFKMSNLLRNQLESLQNGRNLNAVHDLAIHIMKLQFEQAERAKKDAEISRRILQIQIQQGEQRDADAERILRDANNYLLNTLGPVAAAWSIDASVIQSSGANIPTSTPDIGGSVCMLGTRVGIMKDILDWVHVVAPENPCVFWLNGLAGTGKSTIARTICERLDKEGLLGASFFISRDQLARRDANNIIHSIAHQLAVNFRPFSDALCAELRDIPVSAPRSLQRRITDFVITPARRLPADISIIIVIDALDECLSDFLGRPGGELLVLFVQQLLQLKGRLRLFLTSRGEIPIRDMFEELSVPAKTVVKLHELDEAIVRDDITTYLTQSFAEIRIQRRGLPLSDWPPKADVDKLATLSRSLFIYAATAVRFVKDPKYSPRLRLAHLLGQEQNYTGPSPHVHLDGLYRDILNDAVRDSEDGSEYLCKRLHAVMAVIILAQTPLNVEALATFSGVHAEETRMVIDSLASLLAESTSGIRVFHPSFPDFAKDATRCKDARLCVVPSVDHGMIALHCVTIMNKQLRYDLCNIQDPAVANKDVQNLSDVPDVVRYAACFWCTHIASSGVPDVSLLDALEEFCRKHLFHWMEVLSLVEYVPPAELSLMKTIEWCENHPSDTTTFITRLLQDGARVLQVFATPIRSHALHAYHSAWVTMPQCLLLDTLRQEPLPSCLLRLSSPRAEHWGPSPRVLEGHSNGVTCFAYSTDGTRIVSGSRDCTVRVWNAVTFEQLATLGGHRSAVYSVAFSFDNTRVVSSSDDRTVRVWNLLTFEQLGELKGHQGAVNSVAYSRDDTCIISGSDDCTVRVWNGTTFRQLSQLHGHQGEVNSVAVSPKGTCIISGSDDQTVRVWNHTTFKQLAKLDGHHSAVYSLAFSSDGVHLVSGSGDCSLRVWNVMTFKQSGELIGHKGEVYSVAFSSDNTRIVSGSADRTVRVWDATSFEQVSELEDHQGRVCSVSFAPGSTYIVSCSYDRTLRVWNAVIFDQLAKLDGHQGWVHCVAFSPNGAHFVSGSADRTVRVWNAITFEQLAELKGYEKPIVSIMYSDNQVLSSRDSFANQRAWVCLDSDCTTWIELSPADPITNKTCFVSSSDLNITLSDTGWLTCLNGSKCILLWLPVERRGQALARRGRRLVVGAESGTVTVLELPNKWE